MSVQPSATAGSGPEAVAVLAVKNIEVIYDHVILVLRGISLEVPQGGIVSLLGGNGAGKSTTLKSVSTLLANERGAVTKGSIEFRGRRTDQLTPGDMVAMGMVQVMEGRRCFAHPTVEENLTMGAYSRPIKGVELHGELERIYDYFPKLKGRRASLAGYLSGGEQQMLAIGRAMMAKPSMLLLDEPSMGLAPQIVVEIFEIVRNLNQKEGVSILLAEQNTSVALKYADYGYILESGRINDGWPGRGAGAEQGRQGILPRHVLGRPQELPRQKILPPPQAMALSTARRGGADRSALSAPADRHRPLHGGRGREAPWCARASCSAGAAGRTLAPGC
jgi:branched-chain amino acid transport system ATP-binding protein